MCSLIPGSHALVRGTKPAAVGAGRMVSNSYEAFAESFQRKRGRDGRPWTRRATRRKCARIREHAIAFAQSQRCDPSGHRPRAKAQVELRQADRVRTLTQTRSILVYPAAGQGALEQGRVSTWKNSAHNLGERLGKLGMDPAEGCKAPTGVYAGAVHWNRRIRLAAAYGPCGAEP